MGEGIYFRVSLIYPFTDLPSLSPYFPSFLLTALYTTYMYRRANVLRFNVSAERSAVFPQVFIFTLRGKSLDYVCSLLNV